MAHQNFVLGTSVGDLVPEWGVGGQPVEQAVSVPVADRFRGVLVRPLWRAAHTSYTVRFPI